MSLYDLVFEGGGAKGSVFVGAMTAFYRQGHTTRRLIGTSAGAITATLLAAGFTPEQMRAVVNEQKDDGQPRFATFMDVPKQVDFDQTTINNSDTMSIFKHVDVPFLPTWISASLHNQLINALMQLPDYRQLFCFVECGGLFAGNEFLNWIKEQLVKKGFDPNITLAAFNAEINNELSLVASDTDGHAMLVLNHRTAPDCPVAWAVRMSMSIPFVWREVVWQAGWGNYLGQNISGHRIVDGGVLSNFPIALVDKQPLPGSYEEQVMGNTVADDARTMGLLIDETLKVSGQPNQPKPNVIGALKTVQRVTRLIDTMTGSRDNVEILLHKNLVCRLPAQGYGTTEFNMNQVRLNALIQAGDDSMSVFLHT